MSGSAGLRQSISAAQTSFSDRAVGSTVLPCDTGKSHWIAMEIVGEDGKGVADIAYSIKMPDGEVRTGLTDADGLVRCESVAPGVCEFTFPGLDEEAWEPVGVQA